ncbi:hypothetical protein [Streptomyces sp. NPDC052012]|uniref:hypothetical protein n=1 Tax=Streptomyces sp. NPDC052012 TaxID=3155051 RepID=UPI00344C9240
MASRIASVSFTVRLSGGWRWTDPSLAGHQAPAVLARDHLRRQAGRILRQHSVLELEAAQDAANAVLMRWSPLAHGLEAAGVVQLDVPARDRDLAEEHARRQQAADLEHEEEMHRLIRLQRVLADPDLRRVWWTARFPDRFTNLEELTDALQGLPVQYAPEGDDVRGDIRRFTDRLVTTLHTPQQREVFLHALVQTLSALGYHDLKTAAARWQASYDPGSPPE